MTSKPGHQDQDGYHLSNNSVVNINGIRARLLVDGSTGNIQVIPIGKDDILEDDHKHQKKESLPLVNTSSPLPSTSENDLMLSVPVQTNCQNVDTLENDPKDFGQPLVQQNIQHANSECPTSLETEFGEAHPGILNEPSQPDNINPTVAKLGCSIEQPKSTLAKFPQDQVEVNPTRIDHPLDRDVLEQDLLEQFLSSVTHDFQFSTVPAENPQTTPNIEPNIFLPSVKTDGGLVGADPMKGLPISSYSFLTDTELKSMEQTFRQVNTSQSELPIDIEKPAHFNDWSLQTDKVETFPNRSTSLESQLMRSRFPKGMLRKTEPTRTVSKVPKRRGRRAKLTNIGHLAKLKPLRPKPTSQNVLIINVPPTPVCLPNVKSQTQEQRLFITNKPTIRLVPTKAKEYLSHVQNSNIEMGHISTNSEDSSVQSKFLLPYKIMKIDNNQTSRITHNKTEKIETLQDCPACTLKFTTSKLQSHLLTHPNVCAVCERVFDKEIDLFLHLSEHNIDVVRDEDGSTELKCRLCRAQFLHAPNVQRHVLSNCGSRLSSVGLVLESPNGTADKKISTSKTKTSPKKLICHKCGRLLGSKSLTVHLKSHCPADDPDRQTNPVQCNECKNLFRNLMTFKRHFPMCRERLKANSAEDTITCDTCFKIISVHSHSTHKRLYCSAAKPDAQICRFCGTSLKHKHSLRNHVKWHCKKSPSATNPMKCICGKVFRNYKAFQSHYQNHCLVKVPPN